MQDGTGGTDIYAITSGAAGAQFQNTLWEYRTSVGAWFQLSTGQFQQISAATNSAGQAVVFGVLTSGALYEQDPALGVGLDQGFALLSPTGTIVSVSAVTDSGGNPVVYAIVTTGHNLWKHSPAIPGDGWAEMSTGSFQTISTGLNGIGQAIVFGVIADGRLFEQNFVNMPSLYNAGQGAALNAAFTQLSGMGGGPASFLSVSAGRPDTVFGIASDHTLWEHNLSGWQETSVGSFAQIRASETAAQDLVFAALTDGELWEYNAGLLPANPWAPVTINGQPVVGVASSSTT